MNAETASDNRFQTSEETGHDLAKLAYGEATRAAETLRSHGVAVHLFEDEGTETGSIDRRLLSLLRHNSREPIASIAAKSKISRVTARSRLERLLANGGIETFTISLGAGVSSRLIRALMLVKIEGTKSDYVVKELNKIPEVVDINSTSGQWDSIVMLEADTLTHFDLTLRTISRIGGIKMTETSLMLASRRANL